MANEARLAVLVGGAYEAAQNASLWPTLLNTYAEAVGASSGVTLGIHDLRSPKGSITTAVRMDDSYQASYDSYYGGINVQIECGKHLMRPRVVLVGSQMCSEERLVRSEFYNDFLRPQRMFHSMGVVLAQSNTFASYITSLRPREAGPFQEKEVRLLQAFVPHLSKALELRRRIAALEAFQGALADVVDRMPAGCVLLDARGQVLVFNRSAADTMLDGDGLRMTKSGLEASLVSQSQALRKIIAGAAATGTGETPDPGGAMRITRPSQRRDLQVLVVPLHRSARWLGAESGAPAVAVFIGDPEGAREADEAVLARLFALTPAEARLAAALSQGGTLEETAARFMIGIETARTQLKQVFSKTETNRQSELVRLVLNGPSGLCRKPSGSAAAAG